MIALEDDEKKTMTPGRANSTTKIVATPLSKKDFKPLVKASSMNDSFLSFGTDDWQCKTLGASKEGSQDFSFKPDPAMVAVREETSLGSSTSHSERVGQRSRAMADPLVGKSRTSHVSRSTAIPAPVSSSDSKIQNYRMDEWASDDEEDEKKDTASIISATPALDKLKSKKKKAKEGKPKKKKGKSPKRVRS